MTANNIGSHDDWLEARRDLLVREKEVTRLRDELAVARRSLPWVAVDTEYEFATESGTKTLSDLFDGRSQLAVYHFMYGPEWDAGCPSCSFWMDNLNGIQEHLAHRDVTFVAIARAPLAQLLAYRERMGWTVPFVSSFDSPFNVDFHVSFPIDPPVERPMFNFAPITDPPEEHAGMSAFILDGDQVFHTYSTHARGLDGINGAYQVLDLMPRGRDEDALEWTAQWLHRHDEYETEAATSRS